MANKENKEYKKDCKWRNELDEVCTFKPEQCNAKDCDMFTIPFEESAIEKKIEEEKQFLVEIQKQITELKKNGEEKTNKLKYHNLCRQKYDKFIGLTYLAEAQDKLSGNKYSKWIKKYPRLAGKLQSKAIKKLKDFEKKMRDKIESDKTDNN